MTGLTFLSRLTQIAPPYTRFVFLGAGLRLGLPSHPASRRRSCLRLGVSTTSSSRGLSPPSGRPCRAYSRRRRCAPPLARRQRRAQPCRGPPGARRATRWRYSQIKVAHVMQAGAGRSRLPRQSIVQLAAAASMAALRAVARMRSATPTIDPAAARKVPAPARKTGRCS